MRKAILSACVAALLSGPYAMAQAKPDKASDQQSVPVKEVVLYTSGVGYFEHFGTVKGDGSTELHFKTAQINDILKSLLLEDLDKGKIASVTYGSQEPLAHTLKSFQVDLSAAPPMADLLAQLRGAKVTATLPQGQVGGEVLSVEKKKKPAGTGPAIETTILNLLLPTGSIRPIDLDQVSEVTLDDPKLQQELVKALSAVAAARDQDSKPVSIRFTGNGERRVRIGYVVEAPVWKASYRLVLTEDAKNEVPPTTRPTTAHAAAPAVAGKEGGSLQGWAIVENQTDSDWENVQLSLVSGRPMSFIENLYEPLYVTRPIVEPELYASLRPQRYAEAMNQMNAQNGNWQEARAEAKDAELAANGPTNFARRAALQDKSVAGERFKQVTEKLQRQQQAQNALNLAIDPMASVAASASGTSIGEFFQYTVGDVTLARQKSAMLPIVTDSVRTTRMSIYNAAVLADHPLLGARLTNTTGKLLPQGPITVLDGGAYAGDATIEDLPGGQSRLLSYGVDQSVLVHSSDHANVSTMTTAKIVKGLLQVSRKEISRLAYVAQNKGKTDRTLLVEHPRRTGWKLMQPEFAVESTDTLYRFEQTCPAGKTTKLIVEEDLAAMQEFAILPMDLNQVEFYLRATVVPDSVKQALRQAAKLRQTQEQTQRQIQDRQQQLTEITQEQSRIRDNMKAVAASTAYYERLLKELDAQETQIEKLKSDLKELRQVADKQRKELEDYLEGLNVG